MRFLRVEEDVVVETITIPDGDAPADYFHPDLSWLPVPEDQPVEVGWGYRNHQWVAPPEPTVTEQAAALDVQRAEAVAAIKAEAGRRIELVMPFWMVARQVSGGTEITTPIRDEAQRLRVHSDTLEARVNAMNEEALAGFDPGDDRHWVFPTNA